MSDLGFVLSSYFS